MYKYITYMHPSAPALPFAAVFQHFLGSCISSLNSAFSSGGDKVEMI
jgi:hypothetical protein